MKPELKRGIDEAIKRERKAYEFYSALAKKSDNVNASRLFSELAIEEMKHEILLKEYIECMDVSEAKRRLEGKYTVLSLDIVNKLNPTMSSIGLAEGFDIAIQREDSDARSYTDLSIKADNEELSELFESLAFVERSHKNRIKRERERFFGG